MADDETCDITGDDIHVTGDDMNAASGDTTTAGDDMNVTGGGPQMSSDDFLGKAKDLTELLRQVLVDLEPYTGSSTTSCRANSAAYAMHA